MFATSVRYKLNVPMDVVDQYCNEQDRRFHNSIHSKGRVQALPMKLHSDLTITMIL